MLIKTFAEQVTLNPDKVCVRSWKHHFTYRFLDHLADRLDYLIRQCSPTPPVEFKTHPRPNSPTALLLGHNESMIVGILGALKSGHIYVPLDPNYPEDRLLYMLKDSNARLIVTNNENKALVNRLNAKLENPIAAINLDEMGDGAGCLPAPEKPGAGNAAYILYTSGSTGSPKGVVQTHENILYYIQNWTQRFSVNACDRIVLFASFCHDGSVPDIYSALLNGALLCPFDIKRNETIGSPARWLIKERITIWHSVPSLYRYFVKTLSGTETFHDLRLIVLGGEPVRTHDLIMFNKHFNNCEFGNIYGQTESTVSSIWQVPAGEIPAKILIGKPIKKTEILLIDENGNEVSEYEVGEIVLASRFLSTGYVNKMESTRTVFSYDEEIGRLYWTGDLGRRLPGGDIEILGRKDNQVKVRGFRVELGEIETVLLQHPDIHEVVVVGRERDEADNPGSKEDGEINIYLWAYFVSAIDFSISRLREFLSQKLPDYMIPTYFVKLDAMPLSPNRKVDRKALKFHGKKLESSESQSPPTSDLEKKLLAIWQEVLKKEGIGIHDNFFELGGTSMDVIQLNRKLKEGFGIDLPLVTIYRHLTIDEFSRFLSQHDKFKSLFAGNTAGKHVESRDRYVPLEKAPGARIPGAAVIGMAGKFPGAGTIEQFWENLKNGIESVSFLSDSQLEEAAVDPLMLENSHYVKIASVMESINGFDAAFFGYTPVEAQFMDPQVRIFHECAWAALEDAGYDPYQCKEIIGLYAGASANQNWEAFVFLTEQRDEVAQFAARQLFDKDYLCTRVAHRLNLRGPAITMQTACSTSLVAVQAACKGLITGECDIAIAGGVSITNPMKQGYLYREGMIFSSSGHCKTFDSEADGSIFGDGIGVVVLRRLEEAVEQRDHIYAAIKSAYVNNDGIKRAGFTAPGIEGQAAVIRGALKEAGVEAESIGYIEAHGTATPLGDPIEVEALKIAFNTDKKNYCAVGSVKSNIGHLNIAAGIAGFIKTVLSLKHGLIPPTLNFKTPNPAIDFENSPFYVNIKLSPWRNDRYPRRAGVSSFGIGGTNVHVILEEWKPNPNDSPSRNEVTDNNYHLLLLSAKINTALDKMTWALKEHIKKNPHINLRDAAYTLAVGRKVFDYRRMVVCQNIEELEKKISNPVSSKTHTYCAKDVERPVIFMFPGLGAQYENMGLDLYRHEPIFRREVDRCFDILKQLSDYDIKKFLYPDAEPVEMPRNPFPEQVVGDKDAKHTYKDVTDRDSAIHQTHISQMVTFIFEYALAKLLMTWGIEPYAMIGYSFGEFAAACISGVFSVRDALKLVRCRGQAINRMPPGAMMSVPLPKEELQTYLTGEKDVSLALAIDNGPSCIVAGDPKEIADFEKKMKEKKIICLHLNSNHALHCSLMELAAEEFRREVEKIKLNNPRIPYISNVTGGFISNEQATDPSY